MSDYDNYKFERKLPDIDSNSRRKFWLQDCLVDPLEGAITSSNGQMHPLQKKPMEVLVVLAQAQGQVVPSETIIDIVWGARSGGDEGLKRCIHAIRKALGDTSSNSAVVRTVRGRGYACIPLPRYEDTETVDNAAAQDQSAMPRVELQQNRTISAISIILAAQKQSRPDGELVVPLELLKAFLGVIEPYDNAHAYDLGVMSTVIFGLDKNCDDDQVAAIECATALLEATNAHSDLAARIGIATETITVPTLDRFSKPIALNTTAIRAATGLAATAGTGEISLCELTAELSQIEAGTRVLTSSSALVRVPQLAAGTNGHLHLQLVGRDPEFESLLSCWSRAAVGEGLAVYVSGEAGIGKTCLCNRLVTRIREAQPDAVLECHSQSRSSKITLHPIIRCVSDAFGIEEVEDGARRARLIEQRVRELGFTDPLAAQVLSEFLRVDTTESRHMADPGPGMRRTILIEVLTQALIQSSDQPRLLFFEDIHWADTASIELLNQLIDRGPIARIMILVTSRSEFRPDWINRPLVTHINLQQLGADACAQIVRELDTDGVLDAEATKRISDAAAGNPLFLTEVTKSAIASQHPEATLGELLSKSVRHALLSRVDTLGPESEILRYASIIGTDFDLDSLQTLTGETALDLEQHLKKLCDVNMVRMVSRYPKSTYAFGHSILQIAVYESIPTATRKLAHQRLAQYIENSSVQVEKDFLAYHFEAGELFEQAAHAWLEAANRSKENSLFALAQDQYTRALDKLPDIELGEARDELEVQIRIAYGPVLMAQAGYAHEEVKTNYLQVERITQILAAKESEFVPQALFGLWTYRVVNGDLHLAKALGEELFALASRMDNSDLQMEANVMVGVTQTHMGEFEEALEKLHCVIESYDESRHAEHKLLYGQDPGMAANVYCGVVFGEMGDVERAYEYHTQGLIIARKSDHWPTLCFALMLTARHALAAGDLDISALRATECYEIAAEHGFPLWIASGKYIMEATAFAQTPSVETAARMAEYREMCKLVGHALSYLDFSSTLAEAYMDLGDLGAAQNVLDEAKAELDRRVKSADARAVLAALERLEALKAVATDIEAAEAGAGRE